MRMSEDVKQLALDRFGSFLIKNVRDHAISDWDMLLAGDAKSEAAREFYNRIRSLPPEQSELLRDLVPAIVDTTLHHLMWSLDQAADIEVAVTTPQGQVPSLRQVSDGLDGELYFWVPRYSGERFDASGFASD